MKNRTFYFANFEQRRLDQSGLVTIADANVPIINAKLAAVGYPGQAVTTGVYANPADSSNLLAKVDHQINGHDLLTIRYSFYDVRSSNARGAGGLNAPSASAGLDNVDHSLTAGNVLSLSPRLVLETRGQFASGDLPRAADRSRRPGGHDLRHRHVRHALRQSDRPDGHDLSAGEQPLYQTGAHAIRAGVDVLHNAATITFPRSIRGSYSFSSLPNFLAGTCTAVRVSPRRSA